jgi:hypothetical protein
MYELLNFSQYAKYRGVSQPYISKLVKKGIISKSAIVYVGKRPKIVPSIADRDLEKHYNRKSKPIINDGHDDFVRNLPSIDDIFPNGLPEIEIPEIPDSWFK